MVVEVSCIAIYRGFYLSFVDNKISTELNRRMTDYNTNFGLLLFIFGANVKQITFYFAL